MSVSLTMVARQVRRLFTSRSQRKSPIEMQVEHLKKYVKYHPTNGVPPIGTTNMDRLRICWIIPDFLPGAGGHMTIFRVASYLERFGHDVRILIQNPAVHSSPQAALESINRHFQPFSGKVEFFNDVAPDVEGDALIATDRFTCYPANAMMGFVRKFYFVQDYESDFYPAGSESLLTDATYHFDFDCLCAGDWLLKQMSEKFGRWAMSWPLAYDSSVYNCRQPQNTRAPNRIALYARYVTPRRAVELAFMALEILNERGINFEVDFFGWKLGKLSVGFPYRDHGVLNGLELASLYRAATVGVVFSATNHSLVNKEMMACGLPVVDLNLETVRSIFPPETIALAEPTPEGIADRIEYLLGNPIACDSLRNAGLAFVQDQSWEKSARMVESAIKERVRLAVGRKI